MEYSDMAFKYYIHPEDFVKLESFLPVHGLQHDTLDDAKAYYNQCYISIQDYLKVLGCKCIVGFAFRSRANGYIEIDEGKGSARPHQFVQLYTVPIGTCIKQIKETAVKIDDVIGNDPELKYRRQSSKEETAPQEKGLYNPFTKTYRQPTQQPVKQSTTIDYSKWQEDDDIPF